MRDSVQAAAVPVYPLTRGQPSTCSLTDTNSLFSLALYVIYQFSLLAMTTLRIFHERHNLIRLL